MEKTLKKKDIFMISNIKIFNITNSKKEKLSYLNTKKEREEKLIRSSKRKRKFQNKNINHEKNSFESNITSTKSKSIIDICTDSNKTQTDYSYTSLTNFEKEKVSNKGQLIVNDKTKIEKNEKEKLLDLKIPLFMNDKIMFNSEKIKKIKKLIIEGTQLNNRPQLCNEQKELYLVKNIYNNSYILHEDNFDEDLFFNY